ncbi:hypothetical protein ACHAQJ_006164 [Trichoderma viride]
MKSFATIAALVLPLITRVSGMSIHLAFCDDTEGVDSWMIFYEDDSTSFNGQEPSSANICSVSSSVVPNDWVGTHSCTFSTGVTATSTISTAGINTGDFTGIVLNSAGSGFNCMRDDDRQLFTFGTSGQASCVSAHYCLG